MATTITIDQLPLYTPWPERLLGLVDFQFSPKTPYEVTREFDSDKWGKLLSIASESDAPSLESIEREISAGDNEICVAKQNHLQLMTYSDAEDELISLVIRVVQSHLPAAAIVELGCGYGRFLLRIARTLHNVPTFGGEYASSGVELLRVLVATDGLKTQAGWCDFRDKLLTNLRIPPGAIIFTCYATHYIPILDMCFVESLISRKPKVVVHIEPCIEHFCESNLLSALRRAYVVRNDYNQNLVTLLRDAEQRGMLQIEKEIKNVFGTNPLLPASIIQWRPTL